mmetsp:Transcript_41415/g.117198  ORF Transcript_41415/g.117198 Transcript_41415/m.117198 type:complete len:316 (+) Transcript_41415:3-950(+)
MRSLALLSLGAVCLGRRARLADTSRFAPVAGRRPRVTAPASLGGLLLLAVPGSRAYLPLTFEAMDENGDDLVDRMEFMYTARDWLDTAGTRDKEERHLVYDYADKLYHLCDVDGDGVLSEHEADFAAFMAASMSYMAAQRGEEVKRFAAAGGGFDEAFSIIDADRDGRISMSEFWAAMEDLFEVRGMPQPSSESHEMKGWKRTTFQSADFDGDGFLDSQGLEYGGFLVHDRIVRDMTLDFIDELDTDQDGYIGWSEVSELLSRSKRRLNSAKTFGDMILEGFADADRDRSGRLDAMEFYRLVAKIALTRTTDRQS